jgi:hypothetical protein
MLYYSRLDPIVWIGTKSGTTRTSVELPAAYDSTVTKTIKTSGYSVAVFDILYTMGSAETSNSIEIKLEDSVDGVNFYRTSNESASGGTSTLTAREFTFVGTNAAAATISYRIDIAYPYLKISAKETGVAAVAGTVFIEGVLAGN